MRSTIIAAAAAMAMGASAQRYNNNGTAGAAQQSGNAADANAAANGGYQATAYATFVVDAYVTTCPGNLAAPTTFTYNGEAYTGSAGQVLTVTNCPCTVTAPVGSYQSGAKTVTAPYTAHETAPSTGMKTGAGAGSSANGTSSPGPEQFTGGASQLGKVSIAGLAAVFGLAAYAL